jgi:hypothetical protein
MQTSVSPDPIMRLDSREAQPTRSRRSSRRLVQRLYCAPSRSWPSLAELERFCRSQETPRVLTRNQELNR